MTTSWRWYCRWCGQTGNDYPSESHQFCAAVEHVHDVHPGPYTPWFASHNRLLHVWPVPATYGVQP